MTEKQAVKILEEKGWGLITPQTNGIDYEQDFLNIWFKIKPYTMISQERAYALFQSLCYLEKKGIPGDIVECGVWKGGACMLSAETLKTYHSEKRKIWLYDTFEGMTEPTGEDLIASSGQAVSERSPQGWWAVSEDEVKKNMLKTHYTSWDTVKGDVLDTLDSFALPENIALLRLDTDWYESTKKEMEVLFPLLIKGGILLLDDYGHFKGAAKGVDEYFASQGIIPLLQRVDYTGRLYIKD